VDAGAAVAAAGVAVAAVVGAAVAAAVGAAVGAGVGDDDVQPANADANISAAKAYATIFFGTGINFLLKISKN